MKVFVSGATGFIGSRLALKLAEKGLIVHALYRSKEKTKIIEHKNIRLFKGDILDKESIFQAVNGCDHAYHVAGYVSKWTKDNNLIYRLNYEGAVNVIEESIKGGVKKMVVTSTAGVIGDSADGIIDEKNDPKVHFGDYEKTKALLEKKARTFCEEGFPIIIVNPTRVFGPGSLNTGNSVTIMIDMFLKGKWHFIPGTGHSTGNYVFVDDVVAGHILAMEKGEPGERYIIGGENLSYNDFFNILSNETGAKSWMVKVPMSVMHPLASTMLFVANNFSIDPLFTPYHVKKFSQNFKLDISKAKNNLGYEPISFKDGLAKTVDWLKAQNK